MEQLKNKTIIITGATSGIGEAAVRRCLEEGAQVLIHGLDKEKGRSLVQETGLLICNLL